MKKKIYFDNIGPKYFQSPKKRKFRQKMTELYKTSIDGTGISSFQDTKATSSKQTAQQFHQITIQEINKTLQ